MSEVSGVFLLVGFFCLIVCFWRFVVFVWVLVCVFLWDFWVGFFGGLDMLFSVGTASMSFNTNISDL